MVDAAVIGAGILGLAVARRLRERGDEVTVFEAAAQPGGLAASWEHGTLSWDRHYHVILPTDTRTMVLLRSLRLDGEVRWAPASWGIYGGAEVGLLSFSKPQDLLRLPRLTTVDKLRLAATCLASARHGRRSDALEDRSARAWLVQRDGRRTFERFWRPLLQAKLGDDWPYASAAFVASSMGRIQASRQADRLGHLAGGYGRLFDRLSSSLADAGVKLDTGTRVEHVRPRGNRLEVGLGDGSAVFDRVVVTAAAPLAADLCPDLSDVELERLRAVRYLGAVCASLVVPQRLSPYFQTFVADAGAPFGSIVETAPFDQDRRAVVYLSAYVPSDSPRFEQSDDEVLDRFLAYLRQIHPRFDAATVMASRISRVRQVFVLPTVDYSRAMPRTSTTIPGLQLIGSANLPFVNFNVNATLGLLQELR